MNALRAAWLTTLVPALCAQTASVNDLVAAQRKQIESADFRAVGHLVAVDSGGARTSYPITIEGHWFPGVLRMRLEAADTPKTGLDSLVRARVVTRALLELRPNGQNAIWVAHRGDKSAAGLPFAKWNDGILGSGFSYEDFLEQQYFWPEQTIEGQQKFGARDCEVLKSTPGAAGKTHYAQVKSWIDPSIGFAVYSEKTVKESGAVKEFTSYGLRKEQGQWSAHQIEVKLRGQAGSTLLIVDRGSVKANLTAADFSPALLTKF